MSKFVLVILISIVFLYGCSENNSKYPRYEYAIDYYCPDTMQIKMNDWIKETIRATNQHLSAGDYENPDEVIRQAKSTAKELFHIRAEGLHIIKYEGEYMPEFIPQERMTDWEKELFIRLRAEKQY